MEELEDIHTELSTSCGFKTSYRNPFNGCQAGCVTLSPAIQGKCVCPRNTKDDCETEKHCFWSGQADGGKCIHQMERVYNALFNGKRDLQGILGILLP